MIVSYPLIQKYWIKLEKNNRLTKNVKFTKFLPIPLLRVIGTIAYKHFG